MLLWWVRGRTMRMQLQVLLQKVWWTRGMRVQKSQMMIAMNCKGCCRLSMTCSMILVGWLLQFPLPKMVPYSHMIRLRSRKIWVTLRTRCPEPHRAGVSLPSQLSVILLPFRLLLLLRLGVLKERMCMKVVFARIGLSRATHH
jgi:hypothetical protein